MDIRQKLEAAWNEQKLGSVLNEEVERVSTDKGIDKREVIKRLAEGTGVQPVTVTQILKGKIKRPPIKRVEDFSLTLQQFTLK